MDWMDSIWAALALVLIFEGLLPLLAPGQWRQMFTQLLQLRELHFGFESALCIAAGAISLALL